MKHTRRFRRHVFTFLALSLTVTAAGCGQCRKSERDGTVPREPDPARMQPAPIDWEIDTGAPALGEIFPDLVPGPLHAAHLMDLPEDVLVTAEGLTIREGDVRGYIDRAPPGLRDEYGRFAILVLDQVTAEELLLRDARIMAERESWDTSRWSSLILLRRYFAKLTEDIQASEAAIRDFYEENRALFGDTPLEVLESRIGGMIRQRKQEAAVKAAIAALQGRYVVALDAEWARRNAARALDNPVDRARAEAKPVLAAFGADDCPPCRLMAPDLETLTGRYAGRANVVYVDADRNQLLASRYGVRGTPHLIFFDSDGREFKTHSGLMSLAEMQHQFTLLGVPPASPGK